MREWISKLILINEIDVAEDLKKLKRKLTILIAIENLQSCHAQHQILKIIMQKNYMTKLWKAGDDMYDLEALIVSVSDKNYLNDSEYTKNVVKIAVENCIDLAAVVSLIAFERKLI